MKDVFRSGDSSKKFKIAEGQWYRYAPSYGSPAYHLLEGFPFIQEPPSGDLQERVLIRHHDYDQWVQSVQVFFFFQAEDGIRDYKVTGVQTCALPILTAGHGHHGPESDPTLPPGHGFPPGHGTPPPHGHPTFSR